MYVRTFAFATIFAGLFMFGGGTRCEDNRPIGERNEKETVPLPAPRTAGTMSLEEALSIRRSIRAYSDEPLSLRETSQLLWAAQGITSPRGFRTAPSAGALYPMELYLVVSEVEGLTPGVHHYDPHEHTLRRTKEGNFRRRLADAALGQSAIRNAPLNLVVTAVYERTARKYGDRAVRYVRMEAGHVGQNLYLQATALGLGTVTIGAFYDERVKEVLGIEEEPLYIMPIGNPKSTTQR